VAGKSPDVHKTLQFFQSQYQSTARNNICQALPRSAFTESQRFSDVRPHLPYFLVTSKHALHFLRTSLVGSSTLSMTYSINVRPYNDPYMKIVEEAVESLVELLVPGAFLVDNIPILKYVSVPSSRVRLP
jgi:hypothetical protein